MVLAAGGDDKLALAPGTDAVRLHQPTHPLFTDTVTTGHQFLPHRWPTIFLSDLCMEGTDFNP